MSGRNDGRRLFIFSFRFAGGDFDTDSFFIFRRVGKAVDDKLGFVAVDGHEREVFHQVDVSDFDVFGASHVVDAANQRVRLDVVAFAHAEEQTHHVAVVVFFLLFLILSILLILTILTIFVNVQVFSVFVVVEEAVEVQCHHACDEFFASEPAEFFKHYRQIVVDVFAHDVDLFEVVDMAEQLFLAHLLCCWDEGAFERLFQLFLYGSDLMFFFNMHEADADACLVGASCTSAAVYVGIDIVWKVIVDDMCQIVDVETACRHVGGYQNLSESLTEMVHHEVALCLRQVAVKRCSVISVVDEVVGNFLCLKLSAAENDAVNRRVVVDEAFQC